MLEAKVTNVSFSIDRTSSLTVKTTRSRLSGYSPFVGVNLIITGTKEIGRTDEDEPVYKVNQTLVSGTGGIATLSNLEWDSYTISVPNNSSIDIAGTWPFNPVALAPDQALTVTVVTDTASTNSLLVQLESDTQNPLESARLELQSGGSIATTSSGMVNYGDYSQGFFKNLLPGSYGLSILAEGFETATSSVTVAGDKTEHLVINRKASP